MRRFQGFGDFSSAALKSGFSSASAQTPRACTVQSAQASARQDPELVSSPKLADGVKGRASLCPQMYSNAVEEARPQHMKCLESNSGNFLCDLGRSRDFPGPASPFPTAEQELPLSAGITDS